MEQIVGEKNGSQRAAQDAGYLAVVPLTGRKRTNDSKD
jgi:hypothetical protein